MRSLPRAVLTMLVLGTGIRIALAWAPFDPYQVEQGPLVDDSFYYFQIARNVAMGAGPTHDGVVLTSGFQPLWMLMLAPIYLVVPDDPILPIHIAMTVQALLALLSAVLLWRLGRHLAGDVAGFVAAGLWLFSPYILDHGMNGMETALSAALFLGVLTFYLERVRGRWAVVTPGEWVILGALSGLAFLARVDSILLLVALSGDTLWALARGRGSSGAAESRRQLRAPLLCLLGFSLVLPWVVFCLAVSGTPIPESGRAVRSLANLYTSRHLYGEYAAGEAGFYLSNLGLLLRNLLSRPEIPPIGLPVGYLFRRLGMPVWANLFWSAAAAAGLWWAWRRRSARIRFPAFLWGCAALYMLSYTVLVPGQWFYGRYLFPVVVVGILLAGVTTQVVLSLPGANTRRLLIGMAGLMVLAAFVVDGRRRLLRTDGKNIVGYVETARMIDATPWVEAPVGVFQAGVVGYMARKDIVALDGKVNSAVFEATEAGRLVGYLRSRGVTSVTDLYPWLIDMMLEYGDRHNGATGLERRYRPHQTRPFTWLVVSLRPPER